MADQSKYLTREEELPKDLEFVERAPIVTGSASPAPQQGIDRYQGAILSASSLGLDTDVAKSQLPGANPAYRLMPASIAGNPATNASIQSTAAKTAAVTPAPAPATSGSITLDVPNIFTPVTQTVDLPGPLVVGLAAEPPGTYFGTTTASLSSLEATAEGSLTEGGSSTGTLTTTVTPASTPSWGIFCDIYNNTTTPPAGWTGLTGVTGTHGGYYNSSIVGLTPVSNSQFVASNSTAIQFFAIFAGAMPSLVQQGSAAGSTGTLSKAFTSNNTAGNTILVFIMGLNFQTVSSISVSDTAGNTYTTLTYQQAQGAWGESMMVAIATNCIGGANTVNAILTPGGQVGQSDLLQIVELGPLSTGPTIPFFKKIFPSDIPPINLASTGNGGVNGILPVTHGGTGTTTSTGTGSVVLSASPTLTGTLAAGSETLTGKITNYNSLTTVSNGVPSEIATVDLTAQGAAITATNLIASAPASGMYRISWVAKVTQAAATPATSVLGGTNGFQITYTDANDSVVVTTPTWWEGGNNGAAPTNAAGNTTTTYIGGSLIVNAKAATAIQYAIDYTNGGATPMQFNLHVKLEAL